MARVASASGLFGSFATGVEDPLFTYVGTVAVNAAGGFDVAYNNTTFQSIEFDWGAAQSLSASYYSRVRVNPTGLPSTGTANLLRATTGPGASLASIAIGTAGNFHVLDSAGTDITTTTVAATPGTAQCLELHWNAGNGTAGTGTIEAWIDGTQIASVVGTASTGTTAHRYAQAGKVGSTNFGITNINFADFAANDTTGTTQNGRCGLGKTALLKPVGDLVTTGFTTGAGGTSGLAQALKSIPPGGVAVGSATATSQIVDAASNTTDNTQIVLQTPASAGVGSTDTIVLAKVGVSHGNTTTTARTNGVQAVSNPVIAEATGLTFVTVAAAWPTGWRTLWTPYSYAPTVNVNTNPVVEFRKGTATTDSAMACLIGLLVEHIVPPAPQTVIKKAHGGAWV